MLEIDRYELADLFHEQGVPREEGSVRIARRQREEALEGVRELLAEGKTAGALKALVEIVDDILERKFV